MVNVSGLLGTGLGLALFFIFAFTIAMYVYLALALMAIAKKTNTPNPWLAWIPIANMYLTGKIANAPTWLIIAVIVGMFLGWIPFVGILITLGLIVIYIMWWWKIAEARGRPGWWSLLLLLPIVNLVIMGILAWGKP